MIDLILNESNPANRHQTEAFLKKLSTGNDDEKRLLFCIGIDVKNKLTDKNIQKAIFDAIDYDNYLECKNSKCAGKACAAKNNDEYLDGTFKCNRLLSAYEKAIVSTGKFTGIVYDDFTVSREKFCRVMTITAISCYILNKISLDDIRLTVSSARYHIIDGQINELFMPNTAERPRELVWVTPLNDLLAIKKDCERRGENPANEVVNRLGLLIEPGSYEYAYMEYSESFGERVFQPCHLCNSWSKSSLYLSYKLSDRYGRTRPREGDDERYQMKEKVHSAINDISRYKYSIKYLDTIDEKPLQDSLEISNFVGEAMKRYTL
jgi:hypothetical protein